MRIKQFFANAASKALALAATVMMSMAFTACSSDNNDEPKPKPEMFSNTVTLDGVEKPILKAKYDDRGKGNYFLYLNLSADGKERVTIQLNKNLHITGSPIKLTEKEKKHKGKWYWAVNYYGDDGKRIIHTYGDPSSEDPVFNTGTLTMSGSPESTINIKLENGRVKGTDGKEHTLAISYSGKMTEKKL